MFEKRAKDNREYFSFIEFQLFAFDEDKNNAHPLEPPPPLLGRNFQWESKTKRTHIIRKYIIRKISVEKYHQKNIIRKQIIRKHIIRKISLENISLGNISQEKHSVTFCLPRQQEAQRWQLTQESLSSWYSIKGSSHN